MALKRLVSNVKSPDSPYEITFNPKKNVKVFCGPTKSGKTSAVSALQLALFKSCFVDIKGGYVKDGRDIRNRLNAGQDVTATLEYTKGSPSKVNIIQTRHGTVPSGWHSGPLLPSNMNIAADIRDILTRSPEKMAEMLVRFVVRNVTGKDLREGLSEEDTAFLDTFLKKKTISPIEALNKLMASLKDSDKSLKAQLKILQAQQDHTARPADPALVEETQDDQIFWSKQVRQWHLWEQSKRADTSLITSIEQDIADCVQAIVLLQSERADLPQLNEDKLAAYRAAQTLCNFASANSLPSCPICGSTSDIEEHVGEDGDTEHYFRNLAVDFAAAIHDLLHDPALARANEIDSEIKALEQKQEQLRLKKKLSTVAIKVNAPPEYDLEECKAKVQQCNDAQARFSALNLRYKEEQGRQEKIERIQASIKQVATRLKTFKQKKSDLVDSRFDAYLDKARSFMPPPQYMDGGILHVNVGKREIGFLRNGVLELDPSGAELRAIVMAMAIAAGSNYSPPPPIFLDDVGWDPEFFEACCNAWSAYKGEVIAQSTVTPRKSKINDRVEVITTADYMARKVREVVAVSPVLVERMIARPDDYQTSTFRSAVFSLKEGDVISVTTKIRQGRGFIEQTHKGLVSRMTKKNVTVSIDEGVAFTIDMASGQSPWDKNTYISALAFAVVEEKMRSNLIERLGYPANHDIPYDKMCKIWEHMISAEDLPDRAHLIA